MTNLEYIRSLTAEELADWLIVGYDSGDLDVIYETSDGKKFYNDQIAAYDYEVEWLKNERVVLWTI